MIDCQESELDEELEGSGVSGEDELLDEMMHPFNPTDIDIVSGPMSLDTLIKRMRYDEINMNTDFQRHADLWDNRKMSRLIESILIRFPLPAFYFDASEDENWLIVDGLQRLSSIKKFVIDKKLRLSGLEFLAELNGKTFEDLSRQYQRRIEECQITVYTIRPGTPEEVKYSVFRRINTGGLTLNNQEIRNALANPRDRKFLEELAGFECSKFMLGDLSKRMRDQELALRFLAFYLLDYLEPGNKKEIASFLDKAMQNIRNRSDVELVLLKDRYLNSIERSYHLLGDRGFEKSPLSNNSRRFKNSALFEVWMVCFANLSNDEFNVLMAKKDIFNEGYLSLLDDVDFFNSITYSTQKKEHVEIRYGKINTLIREVLND